MRSGKPSRTAQFIAYNRALANLAPRVPGFADPLAVEFLPESWKKRVARRRSAIQRKPAKSPFPFWMRGMGLFNQFRSVVLDQAISAAAPVQQMVILGAGFDTRAYRLEALREAIVYEVDHPDTQTLKRTHAGALQAKARQIRYAATDFHEGELQHALQSTGYDSAVPAFWLWEGVTMYLSAEAVAANLKTIGELSAPGSRVAFTYLSKDRERIPRSIFLSLLGEPVRSAYSPVEIRELTHRRGWNKESDSGIEDWLRAYTPDLRLTRRQAGLQWCERIFVAGK